MSPGVMYPTSWPPPASVVASVCVPDWLLKLSAWIWVYALRVVCKVAHGTCGEL